MGHRLKYLICLENDTYKVAERVFFCLRPVLTFIVLSVPVNSGCLGEGPRVRASA